MQELRVHRRVRLCVHLHRQVIDFPLAVIAWLLLQEMATNRVCALAAAVVPRALPGQHPVLVELRDPAAARPLLRQALALRLVQPRAAAVTPVALLRLLAGTRVGRA